jgi:hypothetical protein
VRRFLLAVLLLSGAGTALAEPIFLARQYPRCTACHFSPTGGGLLTPYGRSLSRVELSMFGRSAGDEPKGREHQFLYGLAGDAFGPVSVGGDLRLAHLDVDAEVFQGTRDFVMNAEISAAFRRENWTAYAQLGRQSREEEGVRVTSFEHWVSYQTLHLGARAGRFLPAYGIRFADHTTFNRATLELDNNDQVYALELSYTGARHLAQATLGAHADTPRALTAAGRWQVDVSPRVAMVASGLFRDSARDDPRSGAAGLALGVAPSARVTLWTQADLRFRKGTTSGPAYTLVGDASIEVHQGVWLRLSAQRFSEFLDVPSGTDRLAAGLNVLPRTHWNVILNWYRDHDRLTDITTRVLLAQLHLYP